MLANSCLCHAACIRYQVSREHPHVPVVYEKACGVEYVICMAEIYPPCFRRCYREAANMENELEAAVYLPKFGILSAEAKFPVRSI